MRTILGITVTISLFFSWSSPVMAIVDPLNQPNNRFGIHITDESDIDSAAELVNSNGGDWGYVTLVIRDDQKDVAHWQKIFDRLREEHLIPIVRIATHVENGVWVKPQSHQVGEWVGFLSSLNWVVKNRYVILFNEPNHSKEWGGSISPEEYTKIVEEFHRHLKRASPDFFILPAGMDAAAPNGSATLDSRSYFERMYTENNKIFTLFDGWVSHAYPNPAFSGSPSAVGKATIRGHEWELNFLKQYGLDPNIPVFITETGWMHRQGRIVDPSLLTPNQVADYLSQAFTTVWNRKNIVAVTPFILNYQESPFDYFSFTQMETKEPLPHYTAVQNLPKEVGEPVQEHGASLTVNYWPESLITKEEYAIALNIKNTGQSIWQAGDVALNVSTSLGMESVAIDSIPQMKPGETKKVWLRLKTPNKPDSHSFLVQAEYRGKPFGNIFGHKLEIVPPTNWIVRTKLWFQRMIYPQDFSIAFKQATDTMLALAKSLLPAM